MKISIVVIKFKNRTTKNVDGEYKNQLAGLCLVEICSNFIALANVPM